MACPCPRKPTREQRERAQRMAAIRGWMDARPYAALSAEMVKRHGKGVELPTL